MYLIFVLSIAMDFISLGNYLHSTDRDDTAVQFSLLLPGAAAFCGSTVSRSAIKAAKKRAKRAAKKAGNVRNKAIKAGEKGTRKD